MRSNKISIFFLVQLVKINEGMADYHNAYPGLGVQFKEVGLLDPVVLHSAGVISSSK